MHMTKFTTTIKTEKTLTNNEKTSNKHEIYSNTLKTKVKRSTWDKITHSERLEGDSISYRFCNVSEMKMSLHKLVFTSNNSIKHFKYRVTAVKFLFFTFLRKFSQFAN